MAAYPFGQCVALILIKPPLTSYGRWISFTSATTLATAAVLRTADTLAANWDLDGKISLSGWRKGAATEFAGRVGFQVALGTADRMLPSAGRMGGPFVREFARTGFATIGDCVAAAPLRLAGGVRVAHLIDDGVNAVCMAFLESALYRAVRSLPRIGG
jgi:hypothetical protein